MKNKTKVGALFKFGDIEPNVDQDIKVTITPVNTSTTYKYKLNASRTSRRGAITDNPIDYGIDSPWDLKKVA